jgi:hypothetical protein
MSLSSVEPVHIYIPLKAYFEEEEFMRIYHVLFPFLSA